MLTLLAADAPGFPERLWHFIGVFHPATVHFPVALLLIAAVFIVVRRVFRGVSADVAFWCLLLGAAGAVAAAAMGWSFAPQRGYGYLWKTTNVASQTMSLHRWGGIVAALFATVAALLAIYARLKPSRGVSVAWQAITIVAAAAVGLVGHWGGEATYGHGYVEEALAKLFPEEPKPEPHPSVKTIAQGASSADPTTTTTTATAIAPGAAKVEVKLPAGKVDFATQIKPILEKHCIACHGEHKQKGKFALHTREALDKGGESGPAIAAGHSDKSKLIELIVTDAEEDLMPPKEKGGPLPKDQIELLRQWIDQGADWPQGLTLQDNR